MRCVRCGIKWSRKTTNPESRDPPCPNLACGEQREPVGIDFSMQKAPGIVGMSTQTKAIDETAKIVMEDYGMTDLRSDVRAGDPDRPGSGETMAPKLPPAQQAAADNFFQPQGRAKNVHGFNTARAVRAAMTGQLRDRQAINPIETLHSAHTPGEKPVNANVIASDRMGRRG
jgi:hypothetical protein